jgi:hypothetical protein
MSDLLSFSSPAANTQLFYSFQTSIFSYEMSLLVRFALAKAIGEHHGSECDTASLLLLRAADRDAPAAFGMAKRVRRRSSKASFSWNHAVRWPDSFPSLLQKASCNPSCHVLLASMYLCYVTQSRFRSPLQPINCRGKDASVLGIRCLSTICPATTLAYSCGKDACHPKFLLLEWACA